MKNTLSLLLFAVILGFRSLSGAESALAETVDVTGTWDLQVTTSQGSGHPVFTFKQQDGKLTGRYQGQFGEADVTGAITGRDITFTFSVSGRGQALQVEYTGTVEGTAMKGRAKFGGFGEGEFTGKKR